MHDKMNFEYTHTHTHDNWSSDVKFQWALRQFAHASKIENWMKISNHNNKIK